MHSFATTSISELTSLDCSTATVCVAAGYLVPAPGGPANAVVTSTTDGGATWTPATLLSPTPYLGAVSCADSQRCWAVGQTAGRAGTVYASTDGGQTWAAQFADTGSVRLDGVSCATASLCIAVGDAVGGAARLLAYNGSTWTTESAPNDSNAGPLFAVSCASTANCTAVGTSTSAQTGPVVILKRVNGIWATQPVPNDAPRMRR